ncbi:sugar transferase [Flagellimonas sp.]|uniref:sugar transferase n=1 Tax=Flagellimonas sp. TaxID=2058762 RepID=UPI003B5CEBCE
MYKSIKRFFDFLAALFGLLLISPVFILVTILLFMANNGHPFYFQKRPGKNGKIFTIVKFKSMNDKKDANGNLLPDEKRITKVGAFVRKTSLDELPQLFNVLKGDMSLIGPRPLMVGYLELYNDFQKKRHLVKPGVTGWAQVNGRNAISWDQKFEYDVYYVENQSFGLDIKILLMTIKKVFISEGISADGSATMPLFTGNANPNEKA